MYSKNVELAKEFALKCHAGQVDLVGAPYAGHLERVANGCDFDEARVVGWLHDTVEDTGVSLEDIEKMFGHDTAVAVDSVTHRKGEPYEDYAARAKTDHVARAVKISDMIDNSNLSRLPKVTMKDVERQAKYNRMLRFLMED